MKNLKFAFAALGLAVGLGTTAQAAELVAYRGQSIDLGAVTYMSSAGLRMLLLLYRQAATQNGRVALAGLTESIRDTMEITGFLKFFTVAGSVEEALTTLRQR